MPERIYVDFNSREDDGIVIPMATAAADGDRYRIGDSVTLYDECLEVQARLHYHVEYKWWIGVPDWKTIRHFS
jgi:hypothetical protein